MNPYLPAVRRPILATIAVILATGVLDDPSTQIACGDIQPWVGAAPNLNPPQSESQPTPIPGTGST